MNALFPRFLLVWFGMQVGCLTLVHAQEVNRTTPSFDVMEYLVVGNTVLPPAAVEKSVQPYLGPDKTFKDVEAARAALEKAYQDAGYLSVVVSLPNQQVSQGEVTLEVTEASVDKLKVTGAQYHLPSRLRQALPSLAAGSTPYFPQMQQELSQAQSRDVQLTPLISGAEDPSKIQVEVKVQDTHPLHGSLEINSRQSFNTEKGRLEANVSHNNLFQRGHTLGASWQYAPTRPSDANTLTLIYGLPVTSDDDITFSFSNSESDTPTQTALGGSTLTKGRTYSVRWNHILDALAWPVTHSVQVAMDYKDNKDSTADVGGFTTPKPPLRYPLLSVGYDLNWRLSEQESFDVSATLSGTSNGLSGRDVDCDGFVTDQFDCKRTGSSGDFALFKLNLVYERPVFKRWGLRAQLGGQWASGLLPSGEQYSLGGVDSVRGYFDAEQTGDQGWAARVELSSPTWWPTQAIAWRAHALAFADRGMVMTKQAQSGEKPRAHLGSYGLGLRVKGDAGLQLGVDVAKPVFATTRAASSGGQQLATDQKLRWEMNVKQSF